MTDSLPSGYSRPELVQAARERVERIRAGLVAIKRLTEETWAELEEAYRLQEYVTLGYVSWQNYCETALDLSRRQTYRIITHAQVVRELAAAAGVDEIVTRVSVTQRKADVIRPNLSALAETLREQTKGKHQATREKVVAEVVEQASRSAPTTLPPVPRVPPSSPAPRYVQLSFDAFWERAEKYATDEGLTLDELVKRAVREYMTRHKSGEAPAAIPAPSAKDEKCGHPKEKWVNRGYGTHCGLCHMRMR